jgi:hypothetical protein
LLKELVKMAKFNPQKIRDIDGIIDVITGKDRGFPLDIAIDMFIKSSYSEKEKVLGMLLENNDESFKTRYLAAIYLGKLNTQKSKDILTRNLVIKDERILLGILKALSFIGDKDSLAQIVNRTRSSSKTIQNRIDFVTSLISYRLDLKDHDLEYPSNNTFTPVPTIEYPFKLSLMKKNDIKDCFESLKYEFTGIEFASDPVYSISFDGDRTQYVLIFNKNIKRGNNKSKNVEMNNKHIIAVIAKKNIEYNNYSISYIVLSSLNEFGQTNIFVTTTDGIIYYAGNAQVNENKIDFSLRSIFNPGVLPLFVEGSIVDDNLQIKSFRLDKKTVKSMIPTKDDNSISKLIRK